MNKHKILEVKESKAGFFNLKELKVQHSSKDKTKVYTVAQHSDWVNIVAETEDKRIVLVNQWRAGIDDLSIEVPGGKIDVEGRATEADAVDAGLRELQEETGYCKTSKSRVLYLGSVDANPAIQDNKMHYVYVNNVEKTEDTDFDEFEDLKTLVYDRKRVLDLLDESGINHSYSVLALYKTFKG